jgi:HEAT repeat protein
MNTECDAMNAEYDQLEHIRMLCDERKSVSDKAILEELAALPVLPAEDDPAWYEVRTWREHASVYLALADIVAERKLRPALLLLLERASYGDPFEIMRGLRHRLEAVVNPDWDALTDVCIQAASRPQRGARLWAIRELGILRDAHTLETVINALDDEAHKVRIEACQSLEMICQTNEECRLSAIEALTAYLDQPRSSDELRAAQESLDSISSAQ